MSFLIISHLFIALFPLSICWYCLLFLPSSYPSFNIPNTSFPPPSLIFFFSPLPLLPSHLLGLHKKKASNKAKSCCSPLHPVFHHLLLLSTSSHFFLFLSPALSSLFPSFLLSCAIQWTFFFNNSKSNPCSSRGMETLTLALLVAWRELQDLTTSSSLLPLSFLILLNLLSSHNSSHKSVSSPQC